MLGRFSAHSPDLLTSSIILKLALQSLRVLRTPPPSPSIRTTRPAEAIAREGPGLAGLPSQHRRAAAPRAKPCRWRSGKPVTGVLLTAIPLSAARWAGQGLGLGLAEGLGPCCRSGWQWSCCLSPAAGAGVGGSGQRLPAKRGQPGADSSSAAKRCWLPQGDFISGAA